MDDFYTLKRTSSPQIITADMPTLNEIFSPRGKIIKANGMYASPYKPKSWQNKAWVATTYGLENWKSHGQFSALPRKYKRAVRIGIAIKFKAKQHYCKSAVLERIGGTGSTPGMYRIIDDSDELFDLVKEFYETAGDAVKAAKKLANGKVRYDEFTFSIESKCIVLFEGGSSATYAEDPRATFERFGFDMTTNKIVQTGVEQHHGFSDGG